MGLAATEAGNNVARLPSTPRARQGWGPEHVFAGLLGLFGLLFVFGMPPCQTPDEPAHFFRAYQISEGRFLPYMVGNWGGGAVPASAVRIMETFSHLAFHAERQTCLAEFAGLWHAPLDPGQRRSVPFVGSVQYSFVPYLPQALGVAVSRWTGCGPLGVFYGGRLANLACTVLCVFWAIRLTPVFKLVFGMIALVPITVHQFASYNPDASSFGAAFLLVAFFLRLAFAMRGVARRRAVAMLFGLAIWLTLCKFPYAALALLYGGVPAQRLGSRRRYLVLGAVLAALLLGTAAAETQLRKFAPGSLATPESGASIKLQFRNIRRHPLRYVRTLSASVAEHGRIYLDHLGTLGWLDTPVNPLAMQFLLGLGVVVALGDRAEGVWPTARFKIFGLLAALLCAAVIMTCIYLCGAVPGALLIIGPQGRYFVPLLVLLLLPLYSRTVRVQAPRRLLLTWAAGGSAAVLLVAVASFGRRYYLPPVTQFWTAPVSLAGAGLLFAAVTGWARRRCCSPELEPTDPERFGKTVGLPDRAAACASATSVPVLQAPTGTTMR